MNAPAPACRRFLGLDLAWSARNPSGTAALDETGRLIDLRADLRSDAAIAAWVHAHLRDAAAPDDAVAIGIDMPTIVRNARGQRDCERDLRRVFGRYHAGPHPSSLERFQDGGRARALLDGLAAAGVVERVDLAPQERARVAFEVFPHPSLVRLFDLDRIFRYKKKSRPWPEVLAEWRRYRAALATLERADPPLVLAGALPQGVVPRGYKAWDDKIDAVTCAYVAAFVWRWGTAAPHVRVFGDLAHGAIVVPDRPA